jgi:hypothetical protein
MEGDCHYLTGNLRARKRVAYAKKILDEIGIGGDRLEMYNMSAAQGPRFVEVANEMTDRIKELGPSPLKAGPASSAGPPLSTEAAAESAKIDETVETDKRAETA